MSEALQAQGEQGGAAAEGGPVATVSTGFLETPARPIGDRQTYPIEGIVLPMTETPAQNPAQEDGGETAQTRRAQQSQSPSKIRLGLLISGSKGSAMQVSEQPREVTPGDVSLAQELLEAIGASFELDSLLSEDPGIRGESRRQVLTDVRKLAPGAAPGAPKTVRLAVKQVAALQGGGGAAGLLARLLLHAGVELMAARVVANSAASDLDEEQGSRVGPVRKRLQYVVMAFEAVAGPMTEILLTTLPPTLGGDMEKDLRRAPMIARPFELRNLLLDDLGGPEAWAGERIAAVRVRVDSAVSVADMQGLIEGLEVELCAVLGAQHGYDGAVRDLRRVAMWRLATPGTVSSVAVRQEAARLERTGGMQLLDRLECLARLEREYVEEERRTRVPTKKLVASLVATHPPAPPARAPPLPPPPAAQTASKWGNPPKKSDQEYPPGIDEAREAVVLGAKEAGMCISWSLNGKCRTAGHCRFLHPQETEMRALVNSPGFWAAMGTWDKYTAAGGASI